MVIHTQVQQQIPQECMDQAIEIQKWIFFRQVECTDEQVKNLLALGLHLIITIIIIILKISKFSIDVVLIVVIVLISSFSNEVTVVNVC